MNEKRLTRELKWDFQHYPYYQMRVDCEKFNGWAALNELTNGDYLNWDYFEKAGKGMCWLTLIPDEKKHSVTAIFMENDEISA